MEFFVKDDGAAAFEELGVLGGFGEPVFAAADEGGQGHDVLFADGVNRRVGDLGEELLEEPGEEALALREDCEGGVVAHAADGFFGGGGHGAEDHRNFLGVDAEGQLLLGACKGVEPIGASGRGVYLEFAQILAEPLPVGSGGSGGAFDFVVAQKFAVDGVDEDHLAGGESAFFDGGFVWHLAGAGFGGHDEEAVGAEFVTGGAEAVAVEAGANMEAVGEDERGGTVPRFIEAGMVVVKVTDFLRHVFFVFPSGGDEHEHGVNDAAPGHGEDFCGVVEAGGVTAAILDDGAQVFDVFAPEVGLEFIFAGGDPVAVALDGVDFAVVGEHAEGVGKGPGGEGVGGVALVEDS